MAENKQYLTRDLEKGTLLVGEDVLETIVVNTLKEIEGVAGLSSRPALDVIEVIGKKNIGKALKIKIDPELGLKVSCNITIFYGCNVVETANAAQAAVCASLEAATNTKVAEINVNVCGVVRK